MTSLNVLIGFKGCRQKLAKLGGAYRAYLCSKSMVVYTLLFTT